MKTLFLFFAIVFPHFLLSQIYFNNNYERNSEVSIGSNVIELDTGGCIFPCCVYGSGYSSFVIIRVNLIGDTLWTKEYRKPLSSYSLAASNSFIKTFDSNYVFSGSVLDSTNNRDALLVKININGDTLWTKTYGGANYDNANKVCQTPDSGFVLMGVTQSFSTGAASDFYLIKTDKNGVFQWQHAYGTTLTEDCFSGQITLDGGYIMSGHRNNILHIVKTDALGNFQWEKVIGSTAGQGFINN